MPEPDVSRLRLCCHLRFCGATEDGIPQSALPHCEDGLFLCSLTISHLGPDERIADAESCRPGRVCFVAPMHRGASLAPECPPASRPSDL
jgi:hypothetical protein